MNPFVRAVALLEISSLLCAASASAQTYGLDARGQIGAFLNNKLPPVASVATGDWTVVNAFPNLTFQDPTFLTFEPGTSRLCVCSREGYIWSFVNDPNTTTKTLFLD
ncbi:MAG: Immunoglobulin I-set domain protein, partial [Pedosphaera sp.]|nr:Immunoglobulin I-set domain protein [Pedosphaera sp.]